MPYKLVHFFMIEINRLVKDHYYLKIDTDGDKSY